MWKATLFFLCALTCTEFWMVHKGFTFMMLHSNIYAEPALNRQLWTIQCILPDCFFFRSEKVWFFYICSIALHLAFYECILCEQPHFHHNLPIIFLSVVIVRCGDGSSVQYRLCAGSDAPLPLPTSTSSKNCLTARKGAPA